MLSYLLVYFIQREATEGATDPDSRREEAEDAQAQAQANAAAPPGSSVGMKQVDLVNWALTYAVDSGTISSEEELLHEMRVLRSIINYLVKKEAVLIDISPG